MKGYASHSTSCEHKPSFGFATMSDAEDIFGGLACAAFCGICCAVAAEEDKDERALTSSQTKSSDHEVTKVGKPLQVNPVLIMPATITSQTSSSK
ncbi:hypothetical protein Ae201684P_012456 [Aphanomyces euteiches]|nr:hypothetical protein Ae201684P_012456 [Aphanomyces euteiches]KAH9152410.1 hypothetical protein AeRB84_005164 [Aphanomyces euteiches]